MVSKQTFNDPIKVKMVKTVPGLANCEDGEFYYDITNERLALKTTEGWETFAQDP